MTIFEALISTISPASCVGCALEGPALCQACATSEILAFGERCWRCNALSPNARTCVSCRSFGGPRHVWISSEYFGLTKQIIKQYKFHHVRPLANEMAKVMAHSLHGYNSPAELVKLNYLIVPVPTATTRSRERSFDHASLLAQKVAKELNFVSKSPLLRIGQASQVGSSRDVRLKQTKGAYVLPRKHLVTGRNILIVDDVLTTGATLREVAKVLRKGGARRVDALVFAKRL